MRKRPLILASLLCAMNVMYAPPKPEVPTGEASVSAAAAAVAPTVLPLPAGGLRAPLPAVAGPIYTNPGNLPLAAAIVASARGVNNDHALLVLPIIFSALYGGLNVFRNIQQHSASAAANNLDALAGILMPFALNPLIFLVVAMDMAYGPNYGNSELAIGGLATLFLILFLANMRR